MHVIDTHIEQKARELLDTLQPGTHNLIGRLKRDLYDGPVYLAPAEEYPFEMVEVDCFDEGARQFDFTEACDELSDILEALPTLYYEEWSGCWNSIQDEGYWLNEEDGEIRDADEGDPREPRYTDPDDDDTEDDNWVWVEAEPCHVVTGSEFKRAILGEQLAGYV